MGPPAETLTANERESLDQDPPENDLNTVGVGY